MTALTRPAAGAPLDTPAPAADVRRLVRAPSPAAAADPVVIPRPEEPAA